MVQNNECICKAMKINSYTDKDSISAGNNRLTPHTVFYIPKTISLNASVLKCTEEALDKE